MKFKCGDVIVRTTNDWKGFVVGRIYTVTSCGPHYVTVEGSRLQPSPKCFEKAAHAPMISKLMEVLDD